VAQEHPSFTITPDDLTGEAVTGLLAFHLAEMHRWSPACKVHAMPVQRLRKPDIAFYTAWANGELAAVGALRELGDGRGEIKSMRAAPQWRGKGAGEAILLHLLAEARARKYTWVGLETGRPEPFQAAATLYRKHGFLDCPAFSDYVSDDFSLCMARNL
jgi:putative acetyltransferase